MARRVTIDQAARILRISRKTVERRIAAGILQSEMEGNRRIIILTDQDEQLDEDKDMQIARLEGENNRLKEEVNFLRHLTASQLATINQLALPAPKETPEESNQEQPAPEQTPNSQEPAAPAGDNRKWWSRIFRRGKE